MNESQSLSHNIVRLIFPAIGLIIISHSNGQTPVSGNISGLWTSNSSPYVVVDNCTIPKNQSLIIQPGVVIWIGENVGITVNGSLQADGAPDQRITFRSTVASQYWKALMLVNTSPSIFKYCDFSNAETALWMGVYGGNRTINTQIEDCTFEHCRLQAVYGEAQGTFFNLDYGPAQIKCAIRNCVFGDLQTGCAFKILGVPSEPAAGSAAIEIVQNVFKGLSGTAFLMAADAGSGSSQATFANNTLFDCATGVDSHEPWDSKIQNNVFAKVNTSIKTSGNLSRIASYNCFYNSTVPFSGYPSTYGKVILQNSNGTPCDLLFNIFSDPLFIATNDFHLELGSPCIDAGSPSDLFNDVCFPPSGGTAINDMGAYGGPGACAWLYNAAPIIGTLTDREINEEQLLTFNVVAKDSDIPVQTLTYSLVSAPDGANIDPVLGIFTWIPSEAQGPGDYSIVLEVSDDAKPTNGVALGTFNVKVDEVNKPPFIDSAGPQTIKADTELRFKVTAIDSDAPTPQTLTFSLEQGAPIGSLINPSIGEFVWTPTADQATNTWNIKVRVTDNGSPPQSSVISFVASPAQIQARLSAKRTPAGGLQLVIDAGTTGVDYSIQVASDLLPGPGTNWTVLKVVHPDQLPFAFEDPDGFKSQKRFYRVLQAP